MKIIAIGDCHFKMVPGVPKSWQRERYYRFIEDIVVECSRDKALLIIAGDSLDSIKPKKEEISVFLHFMHLLNEYQVETLLVGGNHESSKEGESILDYLEVSRFDNVVYRSACSYEGVSFSLCNHDELGTFKPANGVLNSKLVKVLVSHFRCNYSEFVREEIDVKKFIEPYDLCIVGDIHTKHEDGKLVYTNNPINSKFEENPDCSYLKIEIDGGISIKRVDTNYPSLRQLDCSTTNFYQATSVMTEKDFYRIEVKGTPEELRELPNSLPNALVVKIPIMPSVLTKEEAQQILLDKSSGTIEEQLEVYAIALGHTTEETSDLMSELRRQDD